MAKVSGEGVSEDHLLPGGERDVCLIERPRKLDRSPRGKLHTYIQYKFRSVQVRCDQHSTWFSTQRERRVHTATFPASVTQAMAGTGTGVEAMISSLTHMCFSKLRAPAYLRTRSPPPKPAFVKFYFGKIDSLFTAKSRCFQNRNPHKKIF